MTTIDGFESMPSRLVGEAADRAEMAGRAIKFHHAFFDDVLRGILPHDLVLLGAPSGLGKTDLSLSIALSNAAVGKRVHYFALEAEPRELERRTKYSLLSRELFRTKHENRAAMNYTDWLLGACEDMCKPLNHWADQHILENLALGYTFYRGARFDAADLQMRILEIYTRTDLIVIDHLHYIDSDDKANEAQGIGDTVKTIRDVSLRIGKPIILVAHLRKRDQRARQLVTALDDFHGSSNITKICTQAITIDRATCIDPSKWYLAPTFLTVLKDRRSGASGHVALINFDKRTRSYEQTYTLGRLTNGGTEWEQINADDKPKWADHHRQIQQGAES